MMPSHRSSIALLNNQARSAKLKHVCAQPNIPAVRFHDVVISSKYSEGNIFTIEDPEGFLKRFNLFLTLGHAVLIGFFGTDT